MSFFIFANNKLIDDCEIGNFNDFFYFCEQHTKSSTITNYQYKKFCLQDYHRKLINAILSKKRVIAKVFIQGGFSSLMTSYATWLAVTQINRKIGFVNIFNHKYEQDYDRIKCNLKYIKHHDNNGEILIYDTNSSIFLFTDHDNPTLKLDTLIIMDCGEKTDFTKTWLRFANSLNANSSIIIISTPGLKGSWFNKAYSQSADRKFSYFHAMSINCIENKLWTNEDLIQRKSFVTDDIWERLYMATIP